MCLYSPLILADVIFVGGSEYRTITDALQAASEGGVTTIGLERYEEAIETTKSGLTLRADYQLDDLFTASSHHDRKYLENMFELYSQIDHQLISIRRR